MSNQYLFLQKLSRMALYLPTFTTAAAPIFNHPILHKPKPSLQLQFSKPISRKHLSVAHSATQPHKYVYPQPIPEFALATQKFRAELLKKLSKEKEIFGNELDDIVSVCAEIWRKPKLKYRIRSKSAHFLHFKIFNEFLHKEYGGPGTLLVEPFTDMMVALKERKLSGAASAARASLLWAQNYVDQDWESWNSKHSI